MTQPKPQWYDLTVVIPAYNSAGSIERAVRSAVTSGADTVIVVDDGSDDQTGIHAVNAGAFCVRQDNAGAAAARSHGLALTTTSLVLFLDADDTIRADGIADAVSRLANCDKATVAVAGSANCISTESAPRLIRPPSKKISLRGLLASGMAPVPPGAVLWKCEAARRALLTEPAPLDERYADDYELMIRALRGNVIETIDSPILDYSMDGGKSTRRPANSVEASARIRQYYAQAFDISISRWNRRHLTARVLLRRAAQPGLSRAVRTGLQLRAALCDPKLACLLIASRMHFEIRARAPYTEAR